MRRALTIAFALLLCGLAAMSAVAQEIAATPEITDDMVNAIAKKLYCPVCENITLDTCGTAACADWRYEIRLQLEQGRTEQQIIDDFVTRFGDRVVGTPENATLRALSLVTPWVISAGILLILGRMLLARRRAPLPTAAPPSATSAAAQSYEDLIEQDLDK